MRPLLSIDPGLTGTGWALWRTNKRPHSVGVIKQGGTGNEWHLRAQGIAEQLIFLCDNCEDIVSHRIQVVAEFTEFHAAASSSMGWKTGDLQRLTFLCGVIAGRMHPRQFLPVTASGWKGQLPKVVAAKRIEKIIGAHHCSRLGLPEIQKRADTHAWDAVGIGLWFLGRFE